MALKQPRTGKPLRNRVVERRRMKSAELTENGRNWRQHPEQQRKALQGVLAEVGQVGELYAYRSEREGGKLVLIDGHMRVAEAEEWDVAICDLTDAEADKILLTRDPIAAMAQLNSDALESLLGEASSSEDGLTSLLDSLRGQVVPKGQEQAVSLKQVEIKKPPAMAWVLVGIPTVRFGKIAADIERLATIEGIFCETTANDG